VTSPVAMAILGTENPASLCAGFFICPPRRKRDFTAINQVLQPSVNFSLSLIFCIAMGWAETSRSKSTDLCVMAQPRPDPVPPEGLED
jgi:hypothetical protein